MLCPTTSCLARPKVNPETGARALRLRLLQLIQFLSHNFLQSHILILTVWKQFVEIIHIRLTVLKRIPFNQKP